ncbi:MAG TPA: hypothetical protein VK919_04870 [Solirubrobacterales bacterium]|nr:hypothetical protein [Solirubrobacterales bacterium]
MTSEIPDPEPGDPAASVLGSLPRDRLGTRSPRRGPPRSDRGPEAPGERPPPKRSIEELAWGGIAVAAEAATLGVRLANRLFEAGAGRQRPPR